MVERNRLPAIVPYGAGSHHLEVLDLLMSRLGGVSEGIGQANSFDRLLGDAIVNLRSIEFQDIKNSWHNIDSVTELRPDTALFLDAIRPVYYHWIVSSAFMAGPLVELVGGVVGHSPSQRIGRV